MAKPGLTAEEVAKGFERYNNELAKLYNDMNAALEKHNKRLEKDIKWLKSITEDLKI